MLFINIMQNRKAHQQPLLKGSFLIRNKQKQSEWKKQNRNISLQILGSVYVNCADNALNGRARFFMDRRRSSGNTSLMFKC